MEPMSSGPKPRRFHILVARTSEQMAALLLVFVAVAPHVFSGVMRRNAPGAFRHEIARRRIADVAQAEDADHAPALVDHRQSAHLKLLHVPHRLGEVVVVPAAMDARGHHVAHRRATL